MMADNEDSKSRGEVKSQPVEIREATCPACGFHLAAPFYSGGRQPLATLAWPASAGEAMGLRRLDLDFVRCVECGHVFNSSFDYAEVPYSHKPNLMYNRPVTWSKFITGIQNRITARLPENPVVVEIGYGDATFLQALKKLKPEGRYVGFDPHGADGIEGVELRRTLFDPGVHLSELGPDILISRHVLEHLMNPLGFLQRISLFSALANKSVLSYFEVPCVDNAIRDRRTVDFYYEHSSQFTTRSFKKMLDRCVADVEEIGHGYGNEVIYSFSRLGGGLVADHADHIREAAVFSSSAESALGVIKNMLAKIHASGAKVAVWGGTGKSAAFMCRYGLDRERFPVVVDSDPLKVGTFVPGTGQEILFRDHLKEFAPDILIIPPQWRAGDILAEMAECGIKAGRVLIEHEGELVDFP